MLAKLDGSLRVRMTLEALEKNSRCRNELCLFLFFGHQA